MGERKGQNHYYPPDFNYKVHKSLNAYHGVHALRERAKKIKEGILVIRFEMPFNIWCLGCNNHVGMGVRYNAEKKKVGNYYTTPIFEFRMKCHLCDNYYVIRTDPKNFDYELVEGLRRQEKRFDSGQLDNVAPVDRGFSQRLAADAMYKKEHDAEDKKKLQSAEEQLHRIESIQSRMFDDYTANSILRRSFRTEKKSLNEKRAADDDLKKRLSLQKVNLLPESKDDQLMARHLSRLKNGEGSNDPSKEITLDMVNRPLFGEPSTSSTRQSRDAMALLEQMAMTKKRTASDAFNRRDEEGAGGLTSSVNLRKQQRSLGIVVKKTVVGGNDEDGVVTGRSSRSVVD